jgi:hypothetical protein
MAEAEKASGSKRTERKTSKVGILAGPSRPIHAANTGELVHSAVRSAQNFHRLQEAVPWAARFGRAARNRRLRVFRWGKSTQASDINRPLYHRLPGFPSGCESAKTRLGCVERAAKPWPHLPPESSPSSADAGPEAVLVARDRKGRPCEGAGARDDWARLNECGLRGAARGGVNSAPGPQVLIVEAASRASQVGKPERALKRRGPFAD